jgi:WhiB family transcriptional regulator, redox-sensing transcriptional regulator
MTDTVPISRPDRAAAAQGWAEQALCAQADPEAWFPERATPAPVAKAICARCPVLEPCRVYALDRPELRGVWGGMSERERRSARRGRGAAA